MKNLLYVFPLILGLTACQTIGASSSSGDKTQISILPNNPPEIIVNAEKREDDLRLVLMANQGLTEELRLQSYLMSVLARLNNASPRKINDPQIYIISDASPGAFAYSSGSIFITLGLLKALKNEDELAFILAHELSHVMIGHTESEDWTKYMNYAVVAGETALQAIGLVKGAKTQKMTDGITKGLWGAYAGALLGRDVIHPSRTRQDEDEADYLAIDLMVRADYNVGGAVSAMDVLIQAEDDFGREDNVQLSKIEILLRKELEEKNHRKFDDGKDENSKRRDESNKNGNNNHNGKNQNKSERHPDDNDDSSIKSQNYTRPNSFNLSALIYGNAMSLAEQIAKEQSEARRKHRPPQERLSQINSYIDRHYEDAPTPPLKEGVYISALNVPETKKVIESYDLINKLETISMELKNSKLKKKERQEKEAELRAFQAFITTGPMAQDNRIRLLMAEYWRKQGREDLALEELERARRNPRASIVIYRQLIDAYRLRRQIKRAWEVMDEAITRFNYPPGLFPEAISLAQAAGLKSKASDLLIQCKSRAPELSLPCSEAHTGTIFR